jgi:hypothetical protein
MNDTAKTPGTAPVADVPKPRAQRKTATAQAVAETVAQKVVVKAKRAPAATQKASLQKAAQPAAAPAPVPAPAKADKVDKPEKHEKVKLVRDSFTIPAPEYEVLGTLKQRALKGAHPAKKSELLRAGIRLLASLDDAALLAALQAVPSIKTGRPKGKKGD